LTIAVTALLLLVLTIARAAIAPGEREMGFEQRADVVAARVVDVADEALHRSDVEALIFEVEVAANADPNLVGDDACPPELHERVALGIEELAA